MNEFGELFSASDLERRPDKHQSPDSHRRVMPSDVRRNKLLPDNRIDTPTKPPTKNASSSREQPHI